MPRISPQTAFRSAGSTAATSPFDLQKSCTSVSVTERPALRPNPPYVTCPLARPLRVSSLPGLSCVARTRVFSTPSLLMRRHVSPHWGFCAEVSSSPELSGFPVFFFIFRIVRIDPLSRTDAHVKLGLGQIENKVPRFAICRENRHAGRVHADEYFFQHGATLLIRKALAVMRTESPRNPNSRSRQKR